MDARALPSRPNHNEAISIIPFNELRKSSSLLIRDSSEKVCRPVRPSGLNFRILSRATAVFVFSLGILSSCCLHLTFAGCGIGARLDRLSVRCL